MAHPDQAAAERMLARTRRIAVVGLSDRRNRTSHGIAAAMQRRGFTIIPVNPNVDEVLGEKAYASLAEVPGPIDMVNVFRRQEHVDAVIAEAIEVGAKGIWLQQDLVSARGRALAQEAGVDYVEDACLGVVAALIDATPPAQDITTSA